MERLTLPQAPLLLAFSGGQDSSVLLHQLIQQQHPLRLAHINHGLSPHAHAWEKFCVERAVHYGVPLVVTRLNLAPGGNLEARARQARYEALAQIRSPEECLVTAHHQQDQSETFFLALKRGGSSSMQPSGHGFGMPLCRPLLACSKKNIEAYAQEKKIIFVEDESNTDLRFDRNFIRHAILTPCDERWPHFSATLAQVADRLTQQEKLLEALLEPFYEQATQEGGSLALFFLKKNVMIRPFLLRLWLQRGGVGAPATSLLERLWQEVAMAGPQRQPCLRFEQHEVRRFDDALYLLPRGKLDQRWAAIPWPASQKNVTLPPPLTFFRLQAQTPPPGVQRWIHFGPPFPGPNAPLQDKKARKKFFQKKRVPPWLRHHLPWIYYDAQPSHEDCLTKKA